MSKYNRTSGGIRSGRRIKELLKDLEKYEKQQKESDKKDAYNYVIENTKDAIIAVVINRNEQGYYD